ncbi:MAG: hypothetical protein IM638_09955 [Bacteroidetes bacterium]|nr:hypothetical protein [Bacteroidota bacterium]
MKNRISLLVLLFPLLLQGKSLEERPSFSPRYSFVLGLTQPIFLRGFNAEFDLWMKRFVIDYSHGVELKLDGGLVGGELEAQQLNVKIPHSVGFGFGYRFTDGLNLRIEPKLHVFELYNQTDIQTAANRIGRYSTYTLGLGVYYRWLPFQNKQSGLKGITIAPSVRWWPRIASSLSDDKLVYTDRNGVSLTHNALNIGVSNSPWIVNVSVGYSFGK